jgi:hypothetical protein
MGKQKTFKGLVRLVPAVSVSAVVKDSLRTATVDNPMNMLLHKNLLILKISPEDKAMFEAWSKNFNDIHNSDPIELELDIRTKTKKRSLGQNNLLWTLIEVLALETYQECGWEKVIYEEILEIYAPKIESKLHHHKIAKRSSDMDTYECTKVIEGVFYEINQQGITMTDPTDIVKYWNNYNKIRFSGGVDHGYREGESVKDYRQRVNYCEACRKYLRPGTFHYNGQMAHIVSKGNSGESKETWNYFHLCHKDHIGLQHQNGWEIFLKRYPHLRAKYEMALIKHSKGV